MASERNDFIRDIIDEDLRTGTPHAASRRGSRRSRTATSTSATRSRSASTSASRSDYGGTLQPALRRHEPDEGGRRVRRVDRARRALARLRARRRCCSRVRLLPEDVRARRAAHPRRQGVRLRPDRRARSGVPRHADRARAGRARSAIASVDENLDLFRRMQAGEFPDGARVLRAKIDMASPNMKMRDPLLYRIRHAHHHRTGDAWCIYPMYDYAHPLEDAIEGITHSICTLEFENNRELYDWVLDNTGPWNPRPHQYEFARLDARLHRDEQAQAARSSSRTGTSRGWDDPRMPTHRRACAGAATAPEAIRAFCRHDRRREGELDGRHRQARVLRARRSQPDRAARARRAAADRGRGRRGPTDGVERARRAVLPARRRQAGLAHAAVRHAHLHRSRRLARRSAGGLPAPRARPHGAAAPRLLHHRRRGRRDATARSVELRATLHPATLVGKNPDGARCRA